MANVTAMQRARVGDVELEYEVRGSGEPVVLIHGSVIAAEFLPLVREPALSDCTLIRYHRRGLGGSSRTGPATIQQQAADCAGLLAQLDLQTAHVVGHSYGGSIALQLALDRPSLVHTLTLMEPALFMVPSAAIFMEQLGPVFEQYQRGETATAIEMFLQGIGRANAREILNRAVPDGFEQSVRDADTFFQVELPALQAWTCTPEDAARVTQPVLYVHGATRCRWRRRCVISSTPGCRRPKTCCARRHPHAAARKPCRRGAGTPRLLRSVSGSHPGREQRGSRVRRRPVCRASRYGRFRLST
jgi:pimeloyl-ACP methyl ester carboxylesterase